MKNSHFYISRRRVGRVNVGMSHLECGNDQRRGGNKGQTLEVKATRSEHLLMQGEAISAKRGKRGVAKHYRWCEQLV